MSEKDRNNIRVAAGKLTVSIHGIQSLPKHRCVIMESKDAPRKV
jgi:hypothetical protein